MSKKRYFEDVGMHNAWPYFRQVDENCIEESTIYSELSAQGISADASKAIRHEIINGP